MEWRVRKETIPISCCAFFFFHFISFLRRRTQLAVRNYFIISLILSYYSGRTHRLTHVVLVLYNIHTPLPDSTILTNWNNTHTTRTQKAQNNREQTERGERERENRSWAATTTGLHQKLQCARHRSARCLSKHQRPPSKQVLISIRCWCKNHVYDTQRNVSCGVCVCKWCEKIIVNRSTYIRMG